MESKFLLKTRLMNIKKVKYSRRFGILKASTSERLDVATGERSLSVISAGYNNLLPATPPKYSV